MDGETRRIIFNRIYYSIHKIYMSSVWLGNKMESHSRSRKANWPAWKELDSSPLNARDRSGSNLYPLYSRANRGKSRSKSNVVRFHFFSFHFFYFHFLFLFSTFLFFFFFLLYKLLCLFREAQVSGLMSEESHSRESSFAAGSKSQLI